MVRALLSVVVSAALLVGAATAAETKFSLSGTNTKITFVGTKADGKHDGGFRNLTGSVTFDGADAGTLKISVDIDVNSIYSDNQMLTNHLKSGDFFNVKSHPKAKFVSTKVEKNGDGYTVTGNLTLLGKTKPVTFPATIDASSQGIKLAASFSIDRTQWGMTYGKGKVDNEVKLNVELTASK